MNLKTLYAAATALVLGAPVALAQNDELEVTLRVLDDVSEIEGVVLAIEEDSEQAPAGERDVPRGEETPEEGVEQSEPADLEFELDREEESEGELQDFDVPEDFEDEDAEAEAEDSEGV